jgi:hypothetical protein
MNTATPLEQHLDDLITLAIFCQLTGMTKKAVYEKIAAKKWRHGFEIFKDPDGKIWVSRSGYQAWVRQGVTPQALSHEKKQFKSNSNSKVKLTTVTKPSNGCPPQLI